MVVLQPDQNTPSSLFIEKVRKKPHLAREMPGEEHEMEQPRGSQKLGLPSARMLYYNLNWFTIT